MPIFNSVYKGGKLPSEYQEVEYINGENGPYIDTGVAGKTTLKTELKINPSYIAESGILGCNWALNGYFLMFYNNNFRWHGANAVDIPCLLNTDYTIQTENGKITINGTAYTCTASSSVSTRNLTVWYVYNEPNKKGRFKLYYMKIRDGTTLLRDFVPCYRKSDSVIGMYDLATNTFYTNSGTGTFTKGPDV